MKLSKVKISSPISSPVHCQALIVPPWALNEIKIKVTVLRDL